MTMCPLETYPDTFPKYYTAPNRDMLLHYIALNKKWRPWLLVLAKHLLTVCHYYRISFSMVVVPAQSTAPMGAPELVQPPPGSGPAFDEHKSEWDHWITGIAAAQTRPPWLPPATAMGFQGTS